MTAGVGMDADRIATAVQAQPTVADLHGGRFGEIATYLPHRRVRGIRIRPGEITVGVIGRYPATADRIGDDVRTAVTAQPGTAGHAVHVHIADLLPQDNGPAEGTLP
ncbi:hypothetical protein [Amycolatopsis thermalba]|uniref:hypothetical protein n=1 Tax=Amycolatopsis thermalba TaxID=944492 RepID=UPI0019673660|nr:hypothetical protein [Amycolatopsis thermalba]